MEITEKETRLVSLEGAYRVDRAVCGTLALLCATPFILAALLCCGLLWKRPGILQDMAAMLDWTRLCPAALILAALFFLAYRAHSKLVLIGHLKRCLDESGGVSGDAARPGHETPPSGSFGVVKCAMHSAFSIIGVFLSATFLTAFHGVLSFEFLPWNVMAGLILAIGLCIAFFSTRSVFRSSLLAFQWLGGTLACLTCVILIRHDADIFAGTIAAAITVYALNMYRNKTNAAGCRH